MGFTAAVLCDTIGSSLQKRSSFSITFPLPRKVDLTCHSYLSVEDMVALTGHAFQPETRTFCSTGAFLPSWQSKEEPQPRGAAMAGEEEAPCSRLGHPVCGRGGERNLGGLPPGFWQEALRARACRPALLRTPGPCLPGSGAS